MDLRSSQEKSLIFNRDALLKANPRVLDSKVLSSANNAAVLRSVASLATFSQRGRRPFEAFGSFCRDKNLVLCFKINVSFSAQWPPSKRPRENSRIFRFLERELEKVQARSFPLSNSRSKKRNPPAA